MSSQTKDPLEKQDTSTESSESHSDSDVEKAEENLEHLQIEEPLAGGNTDELKPLLDSPDQEESKDDLVNEPAAGPSGLQKPRRKRKSKDVSAPDPDKEDIQEKEAEYIKAKLLEGESEAEDSSSSSPSIERSSGSKVQPPTIPERKVPSAIPSRLRGERNYGMDGKKRDTPSYYYQGLPASLQHTASSSSRRHSYATDSANTSADISEIRSEVAEISADDSVYHEARENVQKEDSPSVYEPAVEAQNSESSDTNASELQEESAPLPTPPGASISTNTGEEGNRAYLARLQKEAEERGVPISTSSGIGSTNQSELAHLQQWRAAGERGSYRPNLEDIIDVPNQEISEHGAEGEESGPAPVCTKDEPVSEGQGMQDFDKLFEQGKRDKENTRDAASRLEQGKVEDSNLGEPSLSVRRKTSKYRSESSSAENVAPNLRPRVKPDTPKKSKMAAGKSKVASQSSSESTEPKSSSSDELHRKESPDIKSSSKSQDPSHSEKGRKSWQKHGQLRSMQLSTVVSKDSVITEEEEDPSSPLRKQNPESMETKDVTPEKMETTPEKKVEDASMTDPSSSKLSAPESSDTGHVSEAATLKEHESSFEVSEVGRPVGQTKRPGGKLSSSPPDERLSSTPPKEAAFRPKKRARADKKPGKTRRPRRDSGGSLPSSVSLERLKPDDASSDRSDYSGSDDEEETRF